MSLAMPVTGALPKQKARPRGSNPHVASSPDEIEAGPPPMNSRASAPSAIVAEASPVFAVIVAVPGAEKMTRPVDEIVAVGEDDAKVID
ncbi:MAG TPA: hypothetical protein VGP25_07250 [Gemmatimonadaceae bacterium]|nr:hypothetical protein [Gemmatimonadaceae bacterium]